VPSGAAGNGADSWGIKETRTHLTSGGEKMKTNRTSAKARMIVTLLGLMVVLAFTAPVYAERGVSDTEVRLGNSMDLTGPIADTTRPIAQGIRLYYEYINDQGGINGRKITFFDFDDQYKTDQTLANIKRLVEEEKIFAVTGIASTHAAIPLIPRLEEYNVPMITLTSSTEICIPPKRLVFVTRGTRENEVFIGLDYAVNDLGLKNPRVALAHPDNEYGRSGARAVKARLEFYGIELVETVIIPKPVVDLTPQVLRLKKAKPDVVYIFELAEASAVLIKTAAKYGLEPLFIGPMDSTREDLIDIAGDSSKNYIGTATYVSWYDDVPGLPPGLREVAKKHPDFIKSRYFVGGIHIGMVAVEAMKRVGPNLFVDSFINALESMKDVNFGDVAAPVSYGPDSRCGSDSARLFKVDISKKRLVPLTGWRKPLSKKP